MKTRAITALFFVAAMLSSFFLGPYFFAVFYLALASACLYEFYTMFELTDSRPNKWLGLVLGVIAFFVAINQTFGWIEGPLIALLLLFAPLVFLDQLFRKNPTPFTGVAHTLLGWIYVMVPFFCFFSIAFNGDSFVWELPLGFMFLLWANDTGAYLTGRAFGKNKLFERISPGKTWEGFVGGILSAILVAVSLSNYTEVMPLWQWIAIAVIVGGIGTLGDLTESMLKRSLHVKDSGNLLPGHGGLLDRFDGLLLAAPAVYVFLYLIKHYQI